MAKFTNMMNNLAKIIMTSYKERSRLKVHRILDNPRKHEATLLLSYRNKLIPFRQTPQAIINDKSIYERFTKDELIIIAWYAAKYSNKK